MIEPSQEMKGSPGNTWRQELEIERAQMTCQILDRTDLGGYVCRSIRLVGLKMMKKSLSKMF
jgi:hypothetical protein